jgi:uncharacterized protein
MQQSGEYRIGAPREAVWRALNDPDVLAACIEGCQSMEKVGDDAFTAAVKAKVGPVSALFNAEVKLADLDPPNGYTLVGAVKGGAAGFGKGTAKVSLSDAEGGATLLRYDVDGSVGGKLAQVGQRLIDGAARKMADDFFAKFGETVAPGAAEMLARPEPTVPAKPGGGRKELVAVFIAIIAVAVLTAYLMMR